MQALSGLTGLKSLGLSQCGGLLAEQVLAATCHHTGLTRLILHDIQLSTDHICALAKASLPLDKFSMLYRCV